MYRLATTDKSPCAAACRQRGAALIMALLIAALAIVLVSQLIRQQDNWLQQIGSRRDLMQARQLASAGIQWAAAVLAQDARQNRYDHLGEPWASQVPSMPAEGGEIGGEISDAQSRFNLNNLVRNGVASPADLLIFDALLQQLGLPQRLTVTLLDTLDGDDETTADGAEDSHYLTRRPAYRAANQPLSDIDNLLYVEGYTTAVIERLRPYVSVLPGYNPVNINTANTMVVAAVLHDFPTAEIQQIMAARERIPYLDLSDFRQRLPNPELKQRPSIEHLGTRSQFFEVVVRARQGRARVVSHTLLQRQDRWPQVLWQKYE